MTYECQECNDLPPDEESKTELIDTLQQCKNCGWCSEDFFCDRETDGPIVRSRVVIGNCKFYHVRGQTQ